jgi:excisionase family DNA binding protein
VSRPAIAALEARDRTIDEKRQQIELALEQARFEAARARRQYEAVDPDNRLVVGELERRWNERLTLVRTLEDDRDALASSPTAPLSAADRERLLVLGRDLELAWNSAGATWATRKQIVRTLINEIVVRVQDDALDLVIHWQGDDHTPLKVKKNRTGQHRWSTEAEVVQLVEVLARQMPDHTIAAVLNRAGKTTGHGNSWTRSRVCLLRRHRQIPPYREGERAERGEATPDEAAATLKISASSVRRLIKDGVLPATHLCKGTPWIIRVKDLQLDAVKRAADARRLRTPASVDPRQKHLNLQ